MKQTYQPMQNYRLLTPYEIGKLAEAIVRKMKRPDRILTTEAVADQLGISPAAVRTRVSRGQLPCHKRDGKLYFSQEELNEYYLSGDTAAGEGSE